MFQLILLHILAKHACLLHIAHAARRCQGGSRSHKPKLPGPQSSKTQLPCCLNSLMCACNLLWTLVGTIIEHACQLSCNVGPLGSLNELNNCWTATAGATHVCGPPAASLELLRPAADMQSACESAQWVHTTGVHAPDKSKTQTRHGTG